MKKFEVVLTGVDEFRQEQYYTYSDSREKALRIAMMECEEDGGYMQVDTVTEVYCE